MCSRGCREAAAGPGAASGCPTGSGSTRVYCPLTSSDEEPAAMKEREMMESLTKCPFLLFNQSINQSDFICKALFIHSKVTKCFTYKKIK